MSRWFRAFLLLLALFFWIVSTVFSLLNSEKFQTYLANRTLDYLNNEIGIQASISSTKLSPFSSLLIKDALVLDSNKDTMIFAKSALVKYDYRILLQPLVGVKLDKVELENPIFQMTTFKGQKNSNFDEFLNKFPESESSGEKFEFETPILINNGTFKYTDFNNPHGNQIIAFVDGVHLKTSSFKIIGSVIQAKIDSLSANENVGNIRLNHLSSDFSIKKGAILFKNLELITNNSKGKFKDFGLIPKNKSWKDYKDFYNSVSFLVDSEDLKVDFSEIKNYVNEWESLKVVSGSLKSNGPINDLDISRANLRFGANGKLNGKVRLKNIISSKNFSIKSNLNNIQTNYREVISMLPSEYERAIPSLLDSLGTIKFMGKNRISRNEITIEGSFKHRKGSGFLDIELQNYNDLAFIKYNGRASLENHYLDFIPTNSFVKNISGTFLLDGNGIENPFFIDGVLDVNIEKVQLFNNQTISNAQFNAFVFGNEVEYSFNINDTLVQYSGLGNVVKNLDYYSNSLDSDLKYLDLKLFGLRNTLSSKITGNFSFTDVEDLVGKLTIKQLEYTDRKGVYRIPKVVLKSDIDSTLNKKYFGIYSKKWLNATLNGNFSTLKLPSTFQNSFLNKFTQNDSLLGNEKLEYEILASPKLVSILDPKTELEKSLVVFGDIDQKNKIFNSEIYTEKIKREDDLLYGLDLEIKNNQFDLKFDRAKIRGVKIYDFKHFGKLVNGNMVSNVSLSSHDDKVNKYDLNYSIFKNSVGEFVFALLPSKLTVNGRDWESFDPIYQNRQKIYFNPNQNYLKIDNISLTNGLSSVDLYGDFEDDFQDLVFDFKNVDFKSILPDVDFIDLDGSLNGNIEIIRDNKQITPYLDLNISNLKVNEKNYGNLISNIGWNSKKQRYDMDIKLFDKSKEYIRLGGFLDTKNEVTQIDAFLVANDIESTFLNSFLNKIISFEGSLDGNIRLKGELTDPNYSGFISSDNLSFYVPLTNVYYNVAPDFVVDVEKDLFNFNNHVFSEEKYGGKGNFNGKITHNLFSNWFLDLEMKADNILSLNTNSENNDSYYGRLFTDGKGTVKGPEEDIKIKIEGFSKPNSKFFIPMISEYGIGTNYISFKKQEIKSNKLDEFEQEVKQIKKKEFNYSVDLDLNINEDVETEIIFDQRLGHTVKAIGNGNVNLFMDTHGVFDLNGIYKINRGQYSFNFGNLVSKKFDVQNGGSISWNGDPYKAFINLNAVYKTRVSNIGELLQNDSFNNPIDVNLIINLSDLLTEPNIKLDLDVPDVGQSIKSAVEYQISSQDERNRQFLSILATQKFLSATNNAAESGFVGTTFEVLSNQVSNILSQINDNLNVGVQYTQGNQLNNVNDELGINLETKINRFTFRSAVGIPIGTVEEGNNNLLNEVEVLYNLNKKGNLQLRAFNKRDEIEDLSARIQGYRQGIGIIYTKDFDSFKELKSIVFNKKQKKDSIKPKK